MGCGASVPNGKGRKRRSVVQEVAVFIPTIRVPVATDVVQPLRGLVSKELVDRLATLRSNVVALAEDIYHGDMSAVSELQRALEEYLPVVLGLTAKESRLEASVQFSWRTIDDLMRGGFIQECCLASAWYEVLSVVHMMAMLALFEANLKLIPRDGQNGAEKKVSEDSKKDVVDSLLRASGCLDYSVHHILVQIPAQIKKSFPSYLQEGMLEAISIQSLAQAHYCLSGCDTSDSYGKKLLLFLKWKWMDAKVARITTQTLKLLICDIINTMFHLITFQAVAYYYHALVLDKGSEPTNHISAVCCLSAADDILAESKRACLSFCLANPITRVPPPWGIMKNMHKKIPDVAYKKFQIYGHLFEQDKKSALQSLPDLPEFPLSLRPEDYEFPGTDSIWENVDCQPQIQSLKEHLEDDPETEDSK
ncbi:unnamed protein product [Triticum turgidum subsp. durum]|uniref:BRO1 domain-containing protein n=1 Tax=Triticum turgidum subsp. durum TaxID=4567 RepID=A0A9R0RBW5_TRITD|nr:unnamed protein product [Triticum turgidum subsp. durum]